MFEPISDDKIILDDDDDVIEVPSEEPAITEIPDDDDDETPESVVVVKEVVIDEDTSSSVQAVNDTLPPDAIEPAPDAEAVATVSDEPTTDAATTVVSKSIADPNEENATYEPVGNESDIQILVPQISVLDLDDFEEKPVDSGTVMDDTPRTPVKIKQEPKDDGYEDEDDGFEEVGTFELDEDMAGTVIICKSCCFSDLNAF